MTDTDIDIVKILRCGATVFYEYSADNGKLLRDAASEIDNLRKALHIVEDDRQQAAEEIDRLRKKNNDLVRTYVAK